MYISEEYFEKLVELCQQVNERREYEEPNALVKRALELYGGSRTEAMIDFLVNHTNKERKGAQWI